MVQHGGHNKIAILVDVQSCRNVSLFLVGLYIPGFMYGMHADINTYMYMGAHVCACVRPT